MSVSVNGAMHMMPNFDLFPQATHHHQSHSRSASVSSSSSAHSSHSRPHSSQGPLLSAPTVVPTMPSAEDIYRSAYPLGRHNPAIPPSHTRHSSTSTAYSTDLTSPADSPPNHNLANPALALKGHLRPTHIRARVAASPYPRDAESVYSSSSETEDMAMFFNPSPPDYTNMYVAGQQSQETFHAAGQFGRMTLGPDHALEQLAANVRAATTTSASDRAKQIFVQAWCVFRIFFPCFCGFLTFSSDTCNRL